MRDHNIETTAESKSGPSRHTVERQAEGPEAQGTFLPQRNQPAHVINGSGNDSSASSHASMLSRATNGRPSRAGQSLLRLQRQYGNRYVQRVLALARKGTMEESAPELEQSIQQARGGGQALDKSVQGQMESAFGAYFGDVRVHTNTQADTLNRELNARAFTTGQDVFFRHGAYNPGSSSGRELIAHELTHVVQQNGDKVQRKLTVGQPGDKYEQEADQEARAVMQQEQRPVQRDSDEGLVRRQVEEEEEEVQMKSEYSRVQQQVEEEEEEEPVQTKVEDAWIQRQTEEEEPVQTRAEASWVQRQMQEGEQEDDELIQPKREDTWIQRQVDEEEEQVQAKAELTTVRRQAEATEKDRYEKKKNEIWNEIEKEAKGKYKDKLKLDLFFMNETYQNQFGRLFDEMNEEQEFVRQKVQVDTSPLTAIPYVGSMAAIFANYTIDKVNKKGWKTVKQLIYGFQEAALDVYGELTKKIFGKSGEEIPKQYKPKRDEFLRDISKRFSDSLGQHYAPRIETEELKKHIHKDLEGFYEEQVASRPEYWRIKFHETIGVPIKILINETLFRQLPTSTLPMGIRLTLTVEEFAALVETKSWSELIERAGMLSRSHQEKLFNVFYYKTLQEAANLVISENLSDVFKAPTKWHAFLEYCEKGTEGSMKIVALRGSKYKEAKRRHTKAVNAAADLFWRHKVQADKNYIDRMKKNRRPEAEIAETLLSTWRNRREKLAYFLIEEHPYNPVKVDELATDVSLKITRKETWYEAMLRRQRLGPAFPEIKPHTGMSF